MAISPNVDFVSGAILTAAQQNQFPRGIMALATSSTTYTITTTEAIATGMTVTFTAVANRYYKLTYYESYMTGSTQELTQRIRLTNAAGAEQSFSAIVPTTTGIFGISSTVKTFSAGSVTLVGTLKAASSNCTATRGATALAYLLVEDVGPA